jgi:membrane protein YdbS with pleckstrin-like domain
VSWRDIVTRVMKVPPIPATPPGSAATVFRAGRNYFRYKLIAWIAGQIVALLGLVVALIIWEQVPMPDVAHRIFLALEIFGWVGYFLQLPFTLGVVVLDFEMRWYIVTDRSLRIREGITTVREQTMTFANIQNISVRQGPLQRFLGIADVEVRTAGGGSSEHDPEKGVGTPVHVGFFRGVDNADTIRDTLGEGVRRQRDSGLGDPDDVRRVRNAAPPDGATDLAEAARELLDEARALRAAMSS